MSPQTGLVPGASYPRMGQRRRNEHRRPGDVVPDSPSDDSSIGLGSPHASRTSGIHSASLGGSHSGTPPTTHVGIRACFRMTSVCLPGTKLGGLAVGAVAPLLPARPPRRNRFPGRRPVDDRAALAGIVFVLKTGITRKQLPAGVVGCSGVTRRPGL